MLARIVPEATVDFVSQEFGTYHSLRIVHALREENRWHHYGQGAVEHPTKVNLQEAFCPSASSWRRSVVKRGRQVLARGVEVAFGMDRNAPRD